MTKVDSRKHTQNILDIYSCIEFLNPVTPKKISGEPPGPFISASIFHPVIFFKVFLKYKIIQCEIKGNIVLFDKSTITFIKIKTNTLLMFIFLIEQLDGKRDF